MSWRLLIAVLCFNFVLIGRSDEIETQAGSAGIWTLEGKDFSLAPDRAGKITRFAWGKHHQKISWSHFGLSAAPDLIVIVNVRPDGDSTRWNLRLENIGSLELHRIRFPRIINLPAQTNEFLAVPEWMGQLAKNPRAMLSDGNRWEWDYPGKMSLQCLALYQQNGPGLSFTCDDTAAYRKSFALWKSNGLLNYELIHHLEHGAVSGKRYDLPYAAIIGHFKGDWFTAAEQYRRWGTNQPWAKQSRLQTGAVPDWVLNTALWVWNRGRSPGVLEPAEILQKELGLPVSVFWHWWHGCAYDTGFPEYLPPREGVASFTTALEKAHTNDLHAIVYMNQRLWGMTTASWTNENAAPFAVKQANGTIKPEVYNSFTKLPCASMCMGTEFWRHKYAGLAEHALKDLGVDGIYMDQACSSLNCYDENHGHPVGGGRYWMQGFQKLSADIRQRAGRPVTLGGEGCGEAWLPYLDVMLTLQVSKERYAGDDGWEPIPFFQAVYHPYAVFYGNYSSLTMPPYDDLWPKEFAPKEPLQLLDRKFARQFRLEQARAWAWGLEPTIANFTPEQLSARRDEIDFAMKLARLRMLAKPYLLNGTFLGASDLKVENKNLDMSRLSIYAGQQNGLKTFHREYAKALGTVWRAPDGTVAVALVNIDGSPVRVVLDMPLKKYGLPKSGNIYRLEADGKNQIERYRSDIHLPFTLGAEEACILVFGKK